MRWRRPIAGLAPVLPRGATGPRAALLPRRHRSASSRPRTPWKSTGPAPFDPHQHDSIWCPTRLQLIGHENALHTCRLPPPPPSPPCVFFYSIGGYGERSCRKWSSDIRSTQPVAIRAGLYSVRGSRFSNRDRIRGVRYGIIRLRTTIITWIGGLPMSRGSY